MPRVIMVVRQVRLGARQVIRRWEAKVNIRCPAVRLAISRNLRVIGCTNFLITSLRTRRGWRLIFTPRGRNFPENSRGEWDTAEEVSVTQNSPARGRTQTMWVV